MASVGHKGLKIKTSTKIKRVVQEQGKASANTGTCNYGAVVLNWAR